MPDLPISIVFALLALVAIALNRKNKNKMLICGCYILGMCFEELVTFLFVLFGVLEDYWEFYFQAISVVDGATLVVMYGFLHQDYKAILYIVWFMVVVNVIVMLEPLTVGTVFVYDVRVQTLEGLNYALLLVMFGRSDGLIRIMDKLFNGPMEKSVVRVFRPANPLVRMGNREKSV